MCLTAKAAPPNISEPTWGRIYLQQSSSPIQYFRDRHGGPMVEKEVTFYIPQREEDRLGCELLPQAEQDILVASNGTMALVLDRGVCSFETKSRNAEIMGAAAVVIVSTDESATAPVALVKDDEIQIASLMIRKSAGDLLRSISKKQKVEGRLIPMICDLKPYKCRARTSIENRYIEEEIVRSGRLMLTDDNTELGQFLGATFGGVLPSIPLQVALSGDSMDSCSSLDNEKDVISGKLLIMSNSGNCSVLDKVSNAQRAGVSVALISVDDQRLMLQPSVPDSWTAYNITITAGVISETTVRKLISVYELNPQVVIKLCSDNSIAKGWDEIRKLSAKAAWPARRERKEKMVTRLLKTFNLDHAQLMELKRNFIGIAGGNIAFWNHLIPETSSEDHTHDEM